MRRMEVANAFAEALRMQQTGQVAGAAARCREILAVDPNHGGANHVLGFYRVRFRSIR